MINIEQGRRWKHYQLTSTNKNFTLDVTLMEQVFEACGYQFTIITPSPSVLVFTGNKPEPYFIVKEVAKALGYKHADNLVRHFREKGIDILKLTKDNGLDELKSFVNNCELPDYKTESLIHKFTHHLLLLPGSSLQEYLLKHSRKHKARIIADKLIQILSGSYTVQTELYDGYILHNHPLAMQIHTETEALGLGKEYSSWHFKYVYKSPYLRKWNSEKKQYNWLNSLMGQKNAVASLWINTGWRYGDKVMLKKAGASKNLTSSYRKVIRINNPSGSDQYLLVQKEYMKAVDERIQDLISIGISEGNAITEVFTSPKLTLKYVLSDDGTQTLLEACEILHDKGYADDQTKEFYDEHFTKKDKQLFQDGKLKIETKPKLKQLMHEQKLLATKDNS